MRVIEALGDPEYIMRSSVALILALSALLLKSASTDVNSNLSVKVLWDATRYSLLRLLIQDISTTCFHCRLLLFYVLATSNAISGQGNGRHDVVAVKLSVTSLACVMRRPERGCLRMTYK